MFRLSRHVLGMHSNDALVGQAVAVDAGPTGVRVFADDSPALTGLFASVEPPALAEVVLVALNGGKRAIEPLPDFMPDKRDGWLLKADRQGLTLWNRPTDRAHRVDPAAFVSGAELYARVALQPYEGLPCAPPGGDLQGRAPAWVDGLRIAHVELLRVLRKAHLEPMAPREPAPPMSTGIYGLDADRVELTDTALITEPEALTRLFAERLPLELPKLLETVLDGGTDELPALPAALGGRPATRVRVNQQVELERGGERTHVDRTRLLALVELDLRRILASHTGPIARDKRPDTGSPPWVGRGRSAWGRALGRLSFDRYQLI